MTEYDPRKRGGRLPSCPKCKVAKEAVYKGRMKISGDAKIKTDEEIKETNDRNMNSIIVSQQPPAMGKSSFTKAMDETAKIVMEDYGLTNLRDNLRAGDNMVMPLSGKDDSGSSLESRVDEVFKPQKNNVMGMMGNKLTSSITAQVNSGALNGYGDVVKRQQDSNLRPNVTYIGVHDERPNANPK